ncbi:DUF21 domain-containing protein [Capsicum baccatum]|uniref:DUF21 domain-containing protein n=1 Tax=Capsicum baccatum TaxID=33114 RepID=A0A2G2WTA7_CAPBA|nr:DUF21 domain-containing protein [Capsicum baccatum]
MFGSYVVDSKEWFYSLATCGRPLNDMVLDWMLGKGHVVLLRRAELKTFVDFHGNEAGKGGDLTHDETIIIVGGALELTEKTTKDAMTPISKAFSLDLDGTLNLWVNFYLEKGIDKSENDTLSIKMVDELPQQTQCVYGAFICAFAKYVIHGRDNPK